MLEPGMAAQLASGCALVVGALDVDGEPYGMRAWGFDVLDDGAGGDGPLVRALLPAGDVARLRRDGLAAGGWRMAITGADIATLRTIQVKGVVERMEPATEADRARADEHAEAFIEAVLAIDRNPRHLLARLPPVDVVACELRVEEVYDQTPGPGAGAPIARAEQPTWPT